MSNDSEPIIPVDYEHDDVRAVAEYRSVSRAAVWAAVLGGASLLAVFSNHLLVVPLLGVVVALAALRQIARSDGALAGKGVATLGLILSVVIGTALLTRSAVTKRLIATQAEPWAIEWCELVRAGEFEVALELTRPVSARRPLDETLRDYYQDNESAQESMVTFRDNALVKRLAESGEVCRIESGKLEQMVHDAAGKFTLVQTFTLHTQVHEGTNQSEEFRLELQKAGPSAEFPGAWHVKNYALSRKLLR